MIEKKPQVDGNFQMVKESLMEKTLNKAKIKPGK